MVCHFRSYLGGNTWKWRQTSAQISTWNWLITRNVSLFLSLCLCTLANQSESACSQKTWNPWNTVDQTYHIILYSALSKRTQSILFILLSYLTRLSTLPIFHIEIMFSGWIHDLFLPASVETLLIKLFLIFISAIWTPTSSWSDWNCWLTQVPQGAVKTLKCSSEGVSDVWHLRESNCSYPFNIWGSPCGKHSAHPVIEDTSRSLSSARTDNRCVCYDHPLFFPPVTSSTCSVKFWFELINASLIRFNGGRVLFFWFILGRFVLQAHSDIPDFAFSFTHAVISVCSPPTYLKAFLFLYKILCIIVSYL